MNLVIEFQTLTSGYFFMATRRAARVGQAILETVSTCILFELRDPRIKNVTVLRVEAAPDLRSAKVVVSVMGLSLIHI